MKIKIHDSKQIKINNRQYSYFALREKNDVNGNCRYRVFITDLQHNAVIETIIKCYNSQIAEHVKILIDSIEIN